MLYPIELRVRRDRQNRKAGGNVNGEPEIILKSDANLGRRP